MKTALTAILVLSCLAPPALADDGLDARRARAKSLKDQGAEAMHRGEAEHALALFREAYQVFPSARLQYNIALAAEKASHPAEAIAAYEIFLVSDQDAPEEARGNARVAVERLQPLVGRIEILDAGDADVLVDRRVVGRGPGPLQIVVDPGPHQVRAVGKAGEVREVSVTVAAGAMVRATPRPIASAAVVAKAPARVPLVRRWWLWTTVGLVAGAGLAVGLGVGLTRHGAEAPGATVPPAF